MRKSLLSVILLVLLFSAPGVWGQGFSAVLVKLDKLEARLDSLEAQLQGLQSGRADLSGLTGRVNVLEKDLGNLKSNHDLEFIENSIVELAVKVKQLEEQNSGSSETAALSAQDMAELKTLAVEMKASLAEKETGREPQFEGTEEESGLSLGNIQLSGFFDLLYKYPENDGADKGFAIGQMEVDLESAFSPYLTIAGAIAYGDEAFEIGAAYADLHWAGEPTGHPVHTEVVTHSGVLAGQFDIPFGADYERIASPDRALVSAPLAVEETVDGWNDLGLCVYGGHDNWESQLYFVNGDQDNLAYGGRLTFALSEYARLGGSLASVMNSDDKLESRYYGGDLVMNREPVELTGEYILKQSEISAAEVDIAGYYVEGKLSFQRWLKHDLYLVGGYSAVEFKDKASSIITDRLNQTTIGAGLNLNENASFRFEYLLNGGDNVDNENVATGQFVVSF